MIAPAPPAAHLDPGARLDPGAPNDPAARLDSAAPLDPAARLDPAALSASMRGWATELWLTGIGVATLDLPADEAFFLEWLRAGFNGEMGYMSRHGVKRSRPR